ncbi:MAG: hypothetical protein AAGG50_02250, partial [Bacteroidota bacterium]
MPLASLCRSVAPPSIRMDDIDLNTQYREPVAVVSAFGRMRAGAWWASLVVLAMCGAVLLASPVAAQSKLPDAPSQGIEAKRYGTAVGQLDATPESITLAFSHEGRLDTTAARIDDGSLADLYVFEGTRGDTVQVAMTSAAFEPYLALGYGASTVAHGRLRRVRPLAEARAVAGRADLAVVLPVDGTYTLVANAAAPGQQGAYTLEAQATVQADVAPAGPTQAEAAPTDPVQTVATLVEGADSDIADSDIADSDVADSGVEAKVATPRLLDAGTPVTGQLVKADPTFSDGTAYQTWLFEGAAGAEV